MHIVILQGAFLPVPPLRGGAVEKMWFGLGKEFAAQGHRVTHISRKVAGLPETEWIDGVFHWRINGYDTPKSGIVLKMLDLIYTLRCRQAFTDVPDVIVTNTFWAPLVLPHSLQRRCFVDVARMPKGQMPLYSRVARLRANSGIVADAIRQELPVQRHDRVVMVPNPLPFTTTEPVSLPEKKPVLLYVGRVHPEKGLDVLIQAYAAVATQYKLIIVGPWDIAAGGGGDSYYQSLVSLSKGLMVTFTGAIYDPEQLNGYYRDAAVFVYPSVAEQGETFGLAPLEAMAWGCVPVVSALACFGDFIRHGENGLVFNHRAPDAVAQLATQLAALQEQHSWREQLAGQALQVRESHSLKHIATDFLAQFSKMNAA